MAKIKWQNKAELEAKKTEREQLKGKAFKTLSTKEKDKLLEILAQEHGLI